MMHAHDSRQIANWFIRRSSSEGMPISIMKVLKLVYMAHGWCLAVLDRPLFPDYVEAWTYGPVVPAVYYAFRHDKTYNLSPFEMEEKPFEPNIEKLLDEVWDMYKLKSAIQLSNLTHVKNGPWGKTYVGLKRNNGVIPNKMIQEHYRAKQERAKSV